MSRKITYRPEIDGLRAIAVLSVVFFHLELSVSGHLLFQGGFIGVDIFFVISGYLITSILLNDLNAGTFSFADFYERRARRILPTLFMVMLLSLPVAWFLLLPKALEDMSSSILSSLIFSSNFWFWWNDSYWAGPSALKPFLHTWSLSVEEQFYVIAPISLLVLWRTSTRSIFPALCGLFVVSLLFAHIYTPTFSEMTFFLLPARAWELLAGSLLCLAEHKYGRPVPTGAKRWLPGFGIGLLILSILLFKEQTPHPSLYTLIPILGTACTIWYGHGNKAISDRATQLLASRWPVRIGLVSYGFYLWHFPVFAFGRVLNETPELSDKAAWMIATLSFTIANYVWIEKPFRSRERVGVKTLAYTLSFAVGLIVTACLVINSTNGAVGRFSIEIQRFAGLSKESDQRFIDYVNAYYKHDVENKRFTGKKPRKILLVGDSYSKDFYNVLKEANVADRHEIVAHYIPSICQNVVASRAETAEVLDAMGKGSCKATQRVGHSKLDEKIRQADAVIIASAWNEITMKYAGELVSAIHALGVDNVLIVGRKQFGTLSARDLLTGDIAFLSNRRFPVSPERFAISEYMRAEGLANYLDLYGIACANQPDCRLASPEGFIMSLDGSHLTREGAQFIAKKLGSDPAFARFWDQLNHAL